MSEDIAEPDPLAGESGMKPPRVPDYEVGYGRPPRHSKFRKGQSGNPNGRPKETTNLVTSFEAMLDEHDVPSRNGVMSKKEAMIRTLFEQAGKCKPRAFAKFMRLSKKSGLLKRPASKPEPARDTGVGSFDMEKFKAGFGKPLPAPLKR